ncbi:MAG: hypothetical protein JO030_01465, partial [Candidatus Eremiobacteraeota bacterium]|nr:hypothetical protein [Candidatus Eremiobacteraeota bacterium]
MHQRTFLRVAPMRARLFFYACMTIALFLTYRLCVIQLIDGGAYARRALAQRSDTVEVFARRGSILDRYGNVLVRSLPSQSVYAVPREILQPDVTVAKLRGVLGHVDPAIVEALRDRRG